MSKVPALFNPDDSIAITVLLVIAIEPAVSGVETPT